MTKKQCQHCESEAEIIGKCAECGEDVCTNCTSGVKDGDKPTHNGCIDIIRGYYEGIKD